MAIIPYTTPEGAQFFVRSDPYRWDVDNRPIGNLLANELALDAVLTSVRDEVVQARTALNDVVYETLDDRLDAMEDSIGSGVSLSDVENLQGHQYGDFIANAEALRRACPTGFLDWQAVADPTVGDAYDDFAGIRTTTSLGDGYQNCVVLWTAWGTVYRPVRALVNGWIVRIFNETAGDPSGTILPNHVTIDLGTAESSGANLARAVFLEVWLAEVDKDNPVFYKNGAVNSIDPEPTTDDHLHPEVIHTVKGMIEGGNWIQLRHRLRVVTPNIGFQSYTRDVGYGLFQGNTFAQGGNADPLEAVYTFSRDSQVDDPGLWRSGSGDAQSKSDLGTYDGYVYGHPVMMVHRRNTGDYDVEHQNGCKIPGVSASGYLASGLSGRPDGLYYDAIDENDIQDLRHHVSISGFNLRDELAKTWQMLVRGDLKTNLRDLRYDYDNTQTPDSEGVWGHRLTYVDRIANQADPHTNPMRDFAVTGAPLAQPDSVRSSWGKNAAVQPIKFTFTQGNAGSVSPSGIVTYSPSTGTLTFNAANLSGHGTGGTKISSTPPVIMQKNDLTSKPTLVCSGLGTQAATVVMSNLTSSAEYVGYIYVVYPGGSGLAYPSREVLHTFVSDGGVTPYKSEQYGTTGTSGSSAGQLAHPRCVDKKSNGNYVIADSLNHRVIELNPSTWSIVHTFGDGTVATPSNARVNTPKGVSVNTANDHVFVVDAGWHRVIELDENFAYVQQFGVTNTAKQDNTGLYYPKYVAQDSTYLYITDWQNHRLVKLTKAGMTYSSQFGTTGVNGAGKTGLSAPSGVTVNTDSGNGSGIWVADTGNKRVVVLSTSLVFKFQIGNQAHTNAITDQSITDVAVDEDGSVYIAIANKHIVKKFNSQFAFVKSFGVANEAGSTNTRLNNPTGLCLDPDPTSRPFLYIADFGNHRVIRLYKDNDLGADYEMTYANQFGITGVGTPYGTVSPLESVCPSPVDVAACSTTGHVYISSGSKHVVLKVNWPTSSASPPTYLAHFGVYGQAGNTTSTCNIPGGLAVNSAGDKLWVVDRLNKRVLILNTSSTTIASTALDAFQVQYPTASLALQIGAIWDVEYDHNGGTPKWYVTVAENPLGANTNITTFAVLKYDNPVGTVSNTPGTQNYATRIVAYGYPVGATVTSTKIYYGTDTQGIAIHDKSTPTTYEFSNSITTNIFFEFDAPEDIRFSTGNVVVCEPNLHCIQRFDSVAGIYLGPAGVPFESGDDAAHLFKPYSAMIYGKWLVICDTQNHRLLKRHIAAPWLAADGTLTSMFAPVGSDKVDIFYSVEAYQGLTNKMGGAEAVWKSSVVCESDKIYVSTMGLGAALTPLYQEFGQLRGMTSRLPLPNGWNDYQLSPVGLKVGTQDAEDDGPYLGLPVTITEGFFGTRSASGRSILSSTQAQQQVVRQQAGYLDVIRRDRGYRTVLPSDTVVPVSTPASSGGDTFFVDGVRKFLAPKSASTLALRRLQNLDLSRQSTIVRRGTPPVRSYNLLEAVPHFTYYPFFYLRYGRLVMGVIAEASNGKNISIGTYEANAFDCFYPHGRILVRA